MPNRPLAQGQASTLLPAESPLPTLLDCAPNLGLHSLQQRLFRRFLAARIDLVQALQHLFPPLALQEITYCQSEKTAAAQPHQPRRFVASCNNPPSMKFP